MRKTSLNRILPIGILLFLVAQTAYSDGGSIPFRSGAKIFEPNQKAIIAWNGEDEILLLSTDLRSSIATSVLQVIPFPSEPKVKKGDLQVFDRLTTFINKELARTRRAMRPLGIKAGTPVPGDVDPGQITFHEKIGSHDVSVVSLKRSRGFVEYVENYLKSKGIHNADIPEALKKLISEYITDGCSWFVFDVVNLDENVRSKDAIQYRFSSPWLYYPLKITSTAEGESKTDLIVLSPATFSHFDPISLGCMKTLYYPIYMGLSSLEKIDRDMGSILKRFPVVTVRTWRVEGQLASFKGDIVAYGDFIKKAAKPPNGSRTFVATGEPRVPGKSMFVGFASRGMNDELTEMLNSAVLRSELVEQKNEGLIEAVRNGNVSTVMLLLDHGADINFGADVFSRPLFLACKYNNLELVRALLERGADINSSGDNGVFLRRSAEVSGHTDLVELLRKHGASDR